MSASNLARRVVGGATVLAVLAVGIAATGGDDEGDQITTTIADAGQLEKGAEVRASGVRVGEVSDIELTDGKAKLTIKLSDGVLPLHQDATLTMRPVNVLGENYIDLDPGTDEAPFTDSTVIPADRTTTAVTL